MIREVALVLRETFFLLKPIQFFYKEEKQKSLLHFQREPVEITGVRCIALGFYTRKYDPQNSLLTTYYIPPIFTVKSSATIQLRAARSLCTNFLAFR